MTCGIEVARRAHETLRLDLMRFGADTLATGDDPAAFRAAHGRLTAFCAEELLPHLERDEQWLIRAEQCPQGCLLATAMRTESRALTAAVGELTAAQDRCGALGAARVVHALFAAHINHAELLARSISHPPDSPREPAADPS